MDNYHNSHSILYHGISDGNYRNDLFYAQLMNTPLNIRVMWSSGQVESKTYCFICGTINVKPINN